MIFFTSGTFFKEEPRKFMLKHLPTIYENFNYFFQVKYNAHRLCNSNYVRLQ